MPINRLLADSKLPPEQQHAIAVAFDYTLRKLSLVDRNDPICEIVARKIIEIGTNGVTNAVAIAEIAYRELATGSRNKAKRTVDHRCIARRMPSKAGR